MPDSSVSAQVPAPADPPAPVGKPADAPAPAGKPAEVLAGNTSTGWLKIIALAFMIIDHIGVTIFPKVPELRILGRTAFPIYCWCMVVGFHYTRSVPKYLLRILGMGLICQPLYAVAMNHLGMTAAAFGDLILRLPAEPALLGQILNALFNRPNIFLTLFLGLLGLWSIREKKYFSHLWGPVLVLTLATLLGADYGWRGVLLILLLYACRSRRGAIAAVMVAFFLYWGTSYSLTQSILGIPIDLSAPVKALREAGLPFLASLVQALMTPVSAFLRMETYALLSLPFILIPFRKKLRLPLWLSYGLYPAHLLLILLLKALLLH